jgi:hypothetical protein
MLRMINAPIDESTITTTTVTSTRPAPGRIQIVAHRRGTSVVRGRGFLLLPAAAFAVHQLRYTLAYGSHADSVLTAQGHSYLNSLAPWLVLLLGLGAGTFLVRVARASAGGANRPPRRAFLELWLLASAILVVVYVVQELLEGLFAAGHPAGFAGVIGHGGWWALVVSLVAGAAVAALLHLAHAVIAVAERLATRRSFLGLPALTLRPRAVSLARRSPLACAAAGRAPPAA